MTRRLLFFVPESYAWPVFRPLAEEAARRGYEIARFVAGCPDQELGVGERSLVTVAEVNAWQPDVVFSVTHWVPTTFPGWKVMVFHGFPIDKRGASDVSNSHFRIRGYYDLYCTMAQSDTARFQSEAQARGDFAVAKTGWPKLDRLLVLKAHSNGIPADNHQPTLFYASTFTKGISSAPHLLGTLKQLATEHGWRVLATLHPKTDPELVEAYRDALSQLTGAHFIDPSQEPGPWMAQADVALTDSSSIIYELLFLDVPVVTYRTTLPGDHLIDVQQTSDIPAALVRAASHPPELVQRMKQARRELHEFEDGSASGRVMDAVEWLIEQGRSQLALRKPPLRARWNSSRKLKAKLGGN